MAFLIFYARGMHALRRLLARRGILDPLDRWAARSPSGLWFRSLFSVLDFEDFRLLDTPWWVLTASRKVDDFLAQTPRARVFEWGSGASTVWLSKRSEHVVSIESDVDWGSRVTGALSPNANLVLVDTPRQRLLDSLRSRRMGFRKFDYRNYVDAIDGLQGDFDLIVIDGRAREACLSKALGRLAKNGMIVFDNTNRRRYQAEIRRHRAKLTVSNHIGLTPILLWPSMTSLIQLREN